jgi:hypothetical protein
VRGGGAVDVGVGDAVVVAASVVDDVVVVVAEVLDVVCAGASTDVTGDTEVEPSVHDASTAAVARTMSARFETGITVVLTTRTCRFFPHVEGPPTDRNEFDPKGPG